MTSISVKRMGLACGVTGAILYLGCVLVMATVDKQTAVFFFNSMMHGVDVSPILRTNMPWWEMAIGLVEFFILSWLVGACVAGIYNWSGSASSS